MYRFEFDTQCAKFFSTFPLNLNLKNIICFYLISVSYGIVKTLISLVIVESIVVRLHFEGYDNDDLLV